MFKRFVRRFAKEVAPAVGSRVFGLNQLEGDWSVPGETETTIPKIIHTCWFGGATKPRRLAHFERVRRHVLRDYQHVEWSEKNIDIEEFPFLERCYRSRSYAHVSDMVRLLKLYEFGGVYVDTDVEILRDFIPILSDEMFLG